MPAAEKNNPMFQTSRDILFQTISLCIAVLTFFIAWCVYYLIRTLGDARHIVAGFRQKIEKVLNLFDTIKDKAETAGEISGAVTKSVIEIIKFVREKKQGKKKEGKK